MMLDIIEEQELHYLMDLHGKLIRLKFLGVNNRYIYLVILVVILRKHFVVNKKNVLYLYKIFFAQQS
jgi:hypothetical protein